LEQKLADWLAQQEGVGGVPALIGEWLLGEPEVDEVLASDDELARTFEEEAHLVERSEPDRAAIVAGSELAVARDTEVRIDRLAKKLLERYGRVAYRPQLVADDSAITASKFGGTGFLRDGETWPACGNCKQRMPLFVQIDLATCPEALKHPHREGLVQLFYCTSDEPLCEVDCRGWQAGAICMLVRWLAPPLRRPERLSEAPPSLSSWRREVQPSRVAAWIAEAPELPDYAEMQRLDSDATEDWTALDDLDVVARNLDKLGGWPSWVQDPAYPNCPDCGVPMQYLLQLESNGACGHQFGDLGRGHLFQCATHPERVAFNWAGH
jgi:hypothetical protein